MMEKTTACEMLNRLWGWVEIAFKRLRVESCPEGSQEEV